VGLLLAGVGLGPRGLHFLPNATPVAQFFAEIGKLLLMFFAAYLTRRVYGYSRNEGHLIWSLSLPQVAATLATAIVAFQAKNADGVRLIDEPVLNTVLVLVVVTSILGPVLTEQYGRQHLAALDSAATSHAVLPHSAVGAVSGSDSLSASRAEPPTHTAS
jgi:Kef-type K+ transport system membrane component KefB